MPPTGVASGSKAGFRPDIEGMRGIAVLAVVLFHAGVPLTPGGFVGVDVFFVLSGYLITGILVERKLKTGHIGLRAFYAARVRRLLPGSALMLACTLAVALAVLSPVEQVLISRAARATAVYFSNVWFMLQASNYFAPDVETNPLLHTWSLAVEEQFYALWPLLLLIGLGRRHSRYRLAAAMSALTVVSFGLSTYLTYTHQNWAFYSSPTRAWEFALGGLATGAGSIRWFQGAAAGRLLGWGGLALVLGSCVAISRQTPFPGYAALAPALGTAAVLVSNDGRLSMAGQILSQRVLQWLGKLSYSWYLWHWPVLVLASALGVPASWVARLALIALSLGIAAVAYNMVERPIRFAPGLIARPTLSLGLAAALTLTTAGLAVELRSHGLRTSALPGFVALATAAADESPLARMGCLANAGEAEVKECTLGASQPQHTIVLFGDSHAAQWFPALERIALNRQWRIVTMLKASCSPAEVVTNNRLIGRIEPECAVWRKAALKRIASLGPTGVIMSGSSGYFKDSGQTAPVSFEEWRDGTSRTLAALAPLTERMVVIADSPRAQIDVPSCLGRSALHDWYPLSACRLTLNEAMRTAERSAAARFEQSVWVDLSDQFCSKGGCSPTRDGAVLFRDSNHVTARYSEQLASILDARMAM
jgi:peptidoglycan/LPS O-acetylase OafA/YrhL